MDDLISAHTPLVHQIAKNIMRRLSSYFILDDLIQAGMLGLVEASKRYKENHGATFKTFAGTRIRGAILDEIRTQCSFLSGTRLVKGLEIFSFDDYRDNASAYEHSSDAFAEEVILNRDLNTALSAIPEDRALMFYRFHEDRVGLIELGKPYGISEGRVSQINTQTAMHLRNRLEGWQNL